MLNEFHSFFFRLTWKFFSRLLRHFRLPDGYIKIFAIGFFLSLLGLSHIFAVKSRARPTQFLWLLCCKWPFAMTNLPTGEPCKNDNFLRYCTMAYLMTRPDNLPWRWKFRRLKCSALSINLNVQIVQLSFYLLFKIFVSCMLYTWNPSKYNLFWIRGYTNHNRFLNVYWNKRNKKIVYI